ncbi:MAG: hypothetical protein A2289_25815 [Deltaproteobacteria bacterium RIFOXYA12_FULL_58_15]|nr:MAG: hypothetical protein A2289_25815 [Deltaproteobacteria bacterium RIFOXYA12_FULL_58_15]OGR11445.1 MAG: hypothetical protein A2341_28250 [Deltaproteobacteria bacterium RIFOXYB12_FULL_58_9]
MEKLTFALDGPVALVTMDDGKANVLSHGMIDALHRALDRAENEARVLVLAGRTGLFCAGFDLGPMTKGPESARDLVKAGTELTMRLLLQPQPVVAACTGHALAAGALLLLSVDTRIGSEGKFKIGLNEVSVGLRLPIFAAELARSRLSSRHLVGATVESRLYDPKTACDVGFLDSTVVVEDCIAAAVREAHKLSKLNLRALADTKKTLRGAMIEHVRRTLEADLADLNISEMQAKG